MEYIFFIVAFLMVLTCDIFIDPYGGDNYYVAQEPLDADYTEVDNSISIGDFCYVEGNGERIYFYAEFIDVFGRVWFRKYIKEIVSVNVMFACDTMYTPMFVYEREAVKA